MEAQVEVDNLHENSRESNPGLMHRPKGSKAAKLVHKEMNIKAEATYAQAEATKEIATATLRKAELMADHNLLMMLIAPNKNGVIAPEAQQYLRLRQAKEVKKLHKRLAQEEALEVARQVKEACHLSVTSFCPHLLLNFACAILLVHFVDLT
jgi:histone H3/H4